MTEETIKRSRTPEHPSLLTRRSSNFLSRTTIREANDHLEMLYKRNQELEQIIHEQKEELNQKDFQYNQLMKSNQLLQRHYQQLQALLDDRAQRLNIYERKEALFRETLELKPAIESLLHILNTFENVDNTSSTISVNTKPLQFIQASNNNLVHHTDTL